MPRKRQAEVLEDLRRRVRVSDGDTDKRVRGSEVEDLLVALIESAQQAEYDFGGAQREWHLPRLQKVMFGFMSLFPAVAVRALNRVKTPYDK